MPAHTPRPSTMIRDSARSAAPSSNGKVATLPRGNHTEHSSRGACDVRPMHHPRHRRLLRGSGLSRRPHGGLTMPLFTKKHYEAIAEVLRLARVFGSNYASAVAS